MTVIVAVAEMETKNASLLSICAVLTKKNTNQQDTSRFRRIPSTEIWCGVVAKRLSYDDSGGPWFKNNLYHELTKQLPLSLSPHL